MKIIKIIFLTILTTVSAYGQKQFSKAYDLELPNVLFCELEVDGNRAFISGTIFDTIQPISNSIIVEMDIEGNLVEVNKIKHNYNVFDIWYNGFQYLGNEKFLNHVEAIDTFKKGVAIIYDLDGNIYHENMVTNPYVPEEDFINADFTQKFGNNIVSVISFSDTINGEIELLVQKYDDQLFLLDSFIINNQYTSHLFEIILYDSFYYFLNSDSQRDSKNFKGFHTIEKRDTNFNVITKFSTSEDSLLSNIYDGVITYDGGIVVGSVTESEYYINPNVNGRCLQDIYIYKVDKDLEEMVWERRIKQPTCNPYFKTIIKIHEYEDHTLLVGGETNIPQGDTNSVCQSFLLKLTEDGDSLWMRYFTHVDKPNSWSLMADFEVLPDGDIFCIGQTIYPGQRGWITRLDSLGCLVPGCHIANEEVDEYDPVIMKLFPNPVVDRLMVHTSVDAEYREGEYVILNMNGQEMRTWPNAQKEVTNIIDVSDYPSGTYLLQYHSHGQILQTKKFIKQ